MKRHANRVAVLTNPANETNAKTTLSDVEAAASTIGLQTKLYHASTSQEISAFFNSRRIQLVQLERLEIVILRKLAA